MIGNFYNLTAIFTQAAVWLAERLRPIIKAEPVIPILDRLRSKMGAGHHHGHGHSHSHGHAHGHGHAQGHGHGERQRNKRRLLLTLVLAASYMIAEVVGGLLSNSLALLADAGHMLSDVAALALSLAALWIAERPPTAQRTFGYYRMEILAALVNAATLGVVAVLIVLEAIERLQAPQPVQGVLMIWIALGGLVMNLLGLWILHGGRAESLNIRGAWLHVLSDALGSVGAITAGLLVWAYGWIWADTLISVVIAVLIIVASWNLLREAVAVLMEHAPGGINVDQVHDSMIEYPGVLSLHSLHVWTITSGLHALAAHVTVEDLDQHQRLLKELRDMLHERFGIDHITIQIELEGFEERQPFPR